MSPSGRLLPVGAGYQLGPLRRWEAAVQMQTLVQVRITPEIRIYKEFVTHTQPDST